MHRSWRSVLLLLMALGVCASGCRDQGKKGVDTEEDDGATPRDRDGGAGEEPPTRRLPDGCAETLDPTTATGFYEAVRCIFEGDDPVQIGVKPGTILPERVAVLQGRVLDREGEPLSGVRVRVLHGSQYGETRTSAAGTYDLAVNGGGKVTLVFEKDGFMRVQRHRDAVARRFVPYPEVVLMPRNPVAGRVALDSMQGPTLVRGPTESDASGERAHAVMFTPGTRAVATMPSGQRIELSDLSVRVTEVTVGERGPEAMPGDLPGNVGYTYALDLSVDEAQAMGAKGVTFDPPLVNYVDNFLGFPAGTTVPVGYYDEEEDVWRPSESGVVLDIVDIVRGKAVLDLDGDGKGDASERLAEYGIDDDELELLAERYDVGQSLWRTKIPHFSFWDLNWGTTLPADGIEPSVEASKSGPEDCRSQVSGSIIGCEDQTLGEVVPVHGTPFNLRYQSERMPGRRDTHEIEIVLSGDKVPDSLLGIELEVTVLGQVTRKHFEPEPNLKHVYRWDGRDAYGRAWQGRQPATIRVGYTYPGQYAETARFGANPGIAISGSVSRQEVTLWTRSEQYVGTVHASARGLGGFTLDAHHLYDPLGGVLHKGDGAQRTSQRLGKRVTRLAGSGNSAHSGDGRNALDAEFVEAAQMVVAPDGTIFIADDEGHRVRRIGPDGRIDTYAGTGEPGVSGDGGPATQAALGNPYGLALAPDGTLYVSQRVDKVVRAIAPDGTITTIAGGGSPEDGVGDGPSALDAEFAAPHGLALDAAGTLYVADLAEFTTDLRYASRVRAIAPDGSIRTVAGGGELRLALYTDGSLRILAGEQKPEEGSAATEADLVTPVSIAVDEQGTLYIAEVEAHRIRKVTPDGRITRIAGNGSEEFSGEGGRALDAGLRPWGIGLAGDGSLYFSDNTNRRIRRVRPDGMIETVAGNGRLPTQPQALAGGPALALPIISPTDLSVDREGRVLFVQARTLLTRLEPALPAFEHHESLLVDESGALAFRFDELGRHLATLDALTGVPLLEFAYDARGLLTAITDRDGNRTAIERAATGRATSIVGPYGQRTELSIDERGLLTRVEDAAGEAYTFEYDEGGLMTAMVAPRSPDERHVFSYDDAGRLVRDESPTGLYQTLSREVSDDGVEVTRTERDVRKYTYTLRRRGDDKIVRRQVDAAGVATTVESGAVTFVEAPTHRTTTTVEADPRFGMQAPYDAVSTLEIEDGPTRVTEKRREARLADKDNPLSLEAYYESIGVNGRESVAHYDASKRTLTVVSPMGRVRTEQRDARGRPTRLQAGTQLPMVFSYDDRGRVAKVTQGDRTLSYAYGADGRVAAITDPLGQRVQLGYDPVGRPNRVVLADGSVVRSSYDANGRLISVAPPERDAHLFSYAPGDLLTSYAPPPLSGGNLAATTTRYAYDPYEALSEIAPPGGASIVMRYEDTSGRLLRETFPGDAVDYAYVDATGQVASLRSQDAALSFSYLGPLLASVSWGGEVAGTVSFEYDDNLWLEQISVGNQSVSFDRDDDGLVTQAGAQVLERDADNGWVVGSAVGGVAETFAYSGYGEVVEHTSRYGGSVLYAREDTRDALGRVVAREETVEGEHRSYAYSYDARGQLRAVTVDGSTRTYRYDENGNRVEATEDGRTTTAVYDSQDRLVRYGETQYTYTPRGSLAEKRSGDDVTRYDYDLRGALRAVDLPDGRQITYLIDGLGRRIGKRIDGALVQGLLYKDLLNPVAELDGGGALRSVFVYGSRSHVPDYMVRAGVSYKLVTDAIGSVRLVVDTATGEVVQRLDYDAFGGVLLDTNPGFQPFGFAGGVYDADTGLVRFGARDYDPETGRWTARDPILFDGGQANLYVYVGNEPVNRIDPNGLLWVPLVGAAIGAGFNMYDAWRAGGSAGDIALAGVVGAGTGTVATLGGALALSLGGGALSGVANKLAMNGILGCSLMDGAATSALLGLAGNALGSAITSRAGVQTLGGMAGRTHFFDAGRDLALAEGLADVAARAEAMAAYNSIVAAVRDSYQVIGTFFGSTAAGVAGEL